MTAGEAGPRHETAQQILDELLTRCRLGSEQKECYRRRLGNALLMEAVETAELFAEEGEGRGEA